MDLTLLSLSIKVFEFEFSLTYRNSSLTIKEYLYIKFLIIILQTTWHNSSLVTSPTTLTPGITSTCQDQSFTTSISFSGASLWNSLPQNIKSCISLFISNVICTNTCLKITFRQIWTDLFESRCLKM